MTPPNGRVPRGPYRTVGSIVSEMARDALAMEDLLERTRENVRDLTVRLLAKRRRELETAA